MMPLQGLYADNLIHFSQRLLIGKNCNKSHVKLSSTNMDKPDVQLDSVFTLKKKKNLMNHTFTAFYTLTALSARSAIMNRLLSFFREKLKSNTNSSAT